MPTPIELIDIFVSPKSPVYMDFQFNGVYIFLPMHEIKYKFLVYQYISQIYLIIKFQGIAIEEI